MMLMCIILFSVCLGVNMSMLIQMIILSGECLLFVGEYVNVSLNDNIICPVFVIWW